MRLNRFLQNQISFTFFLILLVLQVNSIEASESAHEHGVGTLSIAIEEHEQEFSKERQNAHALDAEMAAVADQLREIAYQVNTLKAICDQ